ncbi:hypothetical protein [Vibrio sp. CAU 1672]|uniref:hypothetical protein n=1 Tax=Vibrio sp. CAU 1672 TaxID=3032594 RepID=UPI0023DCE426|nr:hypothetical protein [Vibrio sp. CAU 1672]
MSAVIKTATPFVIKSVLMKALEEVGAEPVLVTEQELRTFSHRGELQLGDILTNRTDYYGPQHFRQANEQWILRHDSSEMNGRVTTLSAASKGYKKVGDFLQLVGNAYQKAYQEHLEILAEQERIRLQEERKARVEATRMAAIEKAKAQGYSVKEVRKGQQIQLVLTRTV